MTAGEFAELAAALSVIDGVTIDQEVPSGMFCSYRVGGPFSLMARVATIEGLGELVRVIGQTDVPSLTVGKGSNLLVSNAGFRGIAIVLEDGFSNVLVDGTTVDVGASASMPVVARATVKAGLTGFEWAVGVPGSIGGAVRMNAGGHGSDMAASLVSVEVADVSLGGIVTRGVESLALDYRSSNLAPWHIVVQAHLELSEAADGEAAIDGEALLREIVGWRREHQPGGANAGSVFTNPPGDSAGRLIDAAGMKGHRVGTAEISEKHANFIQADPDGAADDVMRLMVETVDRVDAAFGIRLHAETRLIGFSQDLVDHVQSSGPGERE